MENYLAPIHPGEILKEDFLEPLGISAYRLAKETFLDQTRISEILRGRRAITTETALRFGRFFGTSPEFWINMQTQYDLECKRNEIGEELLRIQQFKVSGESAAQIPSRRSPNY